MVVSRLALVERTQLSLADVNVVIAGGATMAIDVLVSIFSGFGAGQLRRAETLAHAQELCRAAPVDLLVLDSTLGGDGCAEFTRWLRREKGENRLCPVLLVAANPRTAGIGEARDSGVSYVIAKPVTPKAVFERLVFIVREQRGFVDGESYAGPDRRWRPPGAPPSGAEGRRADDQGRRGDDQGRRLADRATMSQPQVEPSAEPDRRVRES